MFSNQKMENSFLFLKIENKIFFLEHILVVFTCFVRIVFKNNYTNMENENKDYSKSYF